jgi:hypothetical protein
MAARIAAAGKSVAMEKGQPFGVDEIDRSDAFVTEDAVSVTP